MASSAAVPSIPMLGPTPTLSELSEFCRTLGQWVQSREPTEKGADLDKLVTWRSAVESGLVIYSRTGTSGSGGKFTPVDNGSGVVVTDPDLADLTPPDPLTGLTVTSMPTGFFVEFDAPTYSQGGGNAYSIIYAANYSGSGALPTFSSATEIGRVTARSPILVIAAQPGQRTHFWARPVSRAEDAAGIAPQASPTGGTNGVWAICGQLDGATAIVAATIGTAQIADLAVTSAKIVSLSVSKLIAGSLSAGEYIQSTGFVSGSYGFKLYGNGNAEFNNAVVRGTIYATAGQFSGDISGATGTFSGQLAVKSATTGQRLEILTDRIRLYDAAGVKRLSLGNDA